MKTKSSEVLKRNCFHCKKPAKYPSASGKAHCGQVECGMELHKYIKAKQLEKQAKQERKELRERKRKLDDTVPNWTKKAQKAFNDYIRERDKSEGCISCGSHITNKFGGVFDCGHYRSTGANPELRFEPLNAHKQCVKCNQHLSGNVVEYRIRLKDKIGENKLEWLEGPHEPKRYRVEELKEITQHFKKLTKDLKKSEG